MITISLTEVRCYRDQRDKKPEKIFNLKSFDVSLEEIENGIISLKNPLQLGCFIRGSTSEETKIIFEKFLTMQGKDKSIKY